MIGRPWILAGLAAVTAAGSLGAGETPHPRIRQGNRAYDAEDFVEAEVNYRKALEGEAALPVGRFDLGDALYRQGRYEPAAGEFERAATAADGALRADASFNRGNALFRQEKYPESIQAYEDALRADPGHEDARYNLSVARRRLRAQSQSQAGQPQGGDQEKPGDDGKTRPKPDSSSSSKESPSKDDQTASRPPKAGQPPEPQEESSSESERSPAETKASGEPDDGETRAGEPGAGDGSRERAISPAEAERILRAVRDDEKEVQKKLRARAAGRVNVEKDW